jgi:hypothetical protein
MSVRTAQCRCGAVQAECRGEALWVSVCHCLDCQRRSGSAFAAQARFPVEAVTITGETREWLRVAESGNRAAFRFCAACGSDIAYTVEVQPELIAVPLGTFADAGFMPVPAYSVYEGRKHRWVAVVGDEIEHID